MWLSTLKIAMAPLRSVTEIAPKSPFLYVNRSSIRYGFHIGARAIDCGFPELPANRKRQEVTWPGPCRQVHVCTAGPHSRAKLFTGKFFAPQKITIPRLRRNTTFYNSFANWLSNSISKKRNFEHDVSAEIEVSEWMNTNMAAASYHPRILSPKYGQTGNVKPLTANHSLSFAVKWPNLDLKVSNVYTTWES